MTPGLGRSLGEGDGYPPQYSCLENSVDRGAWGATVHGVRRVGHNWEQLTLSLFFHLGCAWSAFWVSQHWWDDQHQARSWRHRALRMQK